MNALLDQRPCEHIEATQPQLLQKRNIMMKHETRRVPKLQGVHVGPVI